MNTYDDYFETKEGYKLSCRIYEKPEAQFTFLVLHGHGEHTGRYEKFAKILEDHPISIAMFNMRGYGNSEGPEVYVDSYNEYIEDVSTFHKYIVEKYHLPKKVILFGHSMGGLIALYWLRTKSADVKALILSSPCLGLILPKAFKCINELFNLFVPRLLYRNPVYPPHLTHNLEEVERYRKDPLIKRKMSVRLLSQLCHFASGYFPGSEEVFDFPVYVLMSGLEKVVDKEKTKRVFEAIDSPQKELVCFDGFYHEIFNELEQEKAFAKLDEFLTEIYAYYQTETK